MGRASKGRATAAVAPLRAAAERRAIREGLLEIANQDSDVALCNQTALDGALMLDGKENE